MTPWTLGWLVWLAWFLVEEGLALRKSQPGATLSEHVWAWFAITPRATTRVGSLPGPPSPITRARRVALLAFMAWLSVHFLTGGSFV